MKRSNERKRGATDSRRAPLRIRRANVCVLAAGVTLIVVGMLLMLPPRDVKSEPGGRYKPIPLEGVFAARRIRVAPLVAWLGFVIVPLSIFPGWRSTGEK